MSIITVNGDRYTADELYQWDTNQVLEISGLNLSYVPEIHFVNSNMDKAIVRQATKDSAGIIRVNIPNSILQVALPITIYICRYDGSAFKSDYTLNIKVKARTKPADYVLTVNDEEVYSFNSLENLVNNTVANTEDMYAKAVKLCNETSEASRQAYNEAVSNLEASESKYNTATTLYNEAREVLAENTPPKPIFVNSVDECTDTTTLYVLPDGYIYAYLVTDGVGAWTNTTIQYGIVGYADAVKDLQEQITANANAITEINETLENINDTGWIELVPLTETDTYVLSMTPIRYRKVNNIVYISGWVDRIIKSVSDVMATLPEDCRPADYVYSSITALNAISNGNAIPMIAKINPNTGEFSIAHPDYSIYVPASFSAYHVAVNFSYPV